MDHELLVALCVLWLSSTWCLFAAAFMWIYNDGEAFHPHSVDMEQRHQMYQVVGAKTKCKSDFAVKSVSEFIAPRGSTSDKHFTVFLITGAVAGFLGTLRWHYVGDATLLEANLAQIGFFSLIIVAMFEVDVSSIVFLEEKLIITCWLIEKLNIQNKLDFKLTQYSPELLELIRSYPDLHRLYEEDDGKLKINPVFLNFNFSMHVIGATGYVIFVTASVILNDLNEEKVAWITGLSFITFASVGYLTGSYIPIFPIFKGWILRWNPFVREPDYLILLQKAINNYNNLKQKQKNKNENEISFTQQSVTSPTITQKKKNKKSNSSSLKSSSSSSSSSSSLTISPSQMNENVKKVLSTYPGISLAYTSPKLYLRILSHIIMTIELISLMTPIVAMGIQWITALCDSIPPISALLAMFFMIIECLLVGDTQCKVLDNSCILANNK